MRPARIPSRLFIESYSDFCGVMTSYYEFDAVRADFHYIYAFAGFYADCCLHSAVYLSAGDVKDFNNGVEREVFYDGHPGGNRYTDV